MDLMFFSTMHFWIWLYVAGAIAYTEFTLVPNAKAVIKTDLWAKLNKKEKRITFATILVCLALWPIAITLRLMRWISR